MQTLKERIDQKRLKEQLKPIDQLMIEYIHKRLVEQRDKQKGVLLVSFELDEIN